MFGSIVGLSGHAAAADLNLHADLAPVSQTLNTITSTVLAPVSSQTSPTVTPASNSVNSPVIPHSSVLITPVANKNSNGAAVDSTATASTPTVVSAESEYLTLASPVRKSSFTYPSTKLDPLLTDKLYAFAGGVSILGLFALLGGIEALSKIGTSIRVLLRRRSMETMK